MRVRRGYNREHAGRRSSGSLRRRSSIRRRPGQGFSGLQSPPFGHRLLAEGRLGPDGEPQGLRRLLPIISVSAADICIRPRRGAGSRTAETRQAQKPGYRPLALAPLSPRCPSRGRGAVSWPCLPSDQRAIGLGYLLRESGSRQSVVSSPKILSWGEHQYERKRLPRRKLCP